MTPDDVIRIHREGFYAALLANDLRKLSEIYWDDYILVRPDGSVLSKSQILDDLKLHPIAFKKLELNNELIRIHGSVGILTGIARTSFVRDAIQSDTRSK